MKISELKPRTNVDVTFKVLEVADTRVTRTGKRVAEALVGDDSGTVLMTLWEEDIDKISVGETYALKKGYVNVYRGSLRLTVGRTGTIEKSSEKIEEVNRENEMSEKRYENYRSYRRPLRRRRF